MATEKRLIDANALSESVSGIGKDMKRPRAVELACLCLIAEAPTVDAVEVVLCKDCKHCYKSTSSSTNYRCKELGVYDTDCEVPPEHFCSFGERKDNDI